MAEASKNGLKSNNSLDLFNFLSKYAFNIKKSFHRWFVKLDLRKTSPSSGSSSRDEQSLLSDGGVAIATPKEETGIDRSGGELGVVGILSKSSKMHSKNFEEYN